MAFNNDREKYNAYMREYIKKRAKEKRKWAIDKLGGKCVECGSTDNLEIDHIDPKKKSFTFGKLWSLAKSKVEAELAKCQLLCTDCHRKKNLIDGHLQSRFEHGTYTSYRHANCRCELCRQACATHNRLYRIKKKYDVYE